MAGWNFADMWEAAADELPDAPAITQGEYRLNWSTFDQRADGVAAWLLDLGLSKQDKVAQYLYNSPEYLESMFGSYKAGLVPVNTNYRYADDELIYLWDNADAAAIVLHACFTDRVEHLRGRLSKVRGWLWVNDGSGVPCPQWAIDYDEVARSKHPRQYAAWGRDGDHLYMLYTGGTTGMPKGVMWRQDDLVMMLAGQLGLGLPEVPDYQLIRSMRTSPGPIALPACPLMHGTGALVSMSTLVQGGSVVLLSQHNYDPLELLDTVAREKVNVVIIVGDVFAKPMLRALDAEPVRWDLSSVAAITSSGVMWSEKTKQGLLRHNANMLLIDAFSSSEALGMGASISGGASATRTATFHLGPDAVVISQDDTFVAPGSGEIGLVGVGGRVPVGYFKDEVKSAATFRVINGKRYSIPGDYATVDANGTIQILGRGSGCINTGGEKVFPEEVEEVLKTHPSVRDAVVVGVPDDKWGEAIIALVELEPGLVPSEQELITHVRGTLSPFKAPKRVLVIESLERAPNGKVDYGHCRTQAMARTSLVG